MDFMSNNMYNNINSTGSQLNSIHNKNEYLVDIHSNNIIGVGSDMRMNSFASSDLSGKEVKTKNQMRQWIVGNKIIQITTGLFANICLEEPTLASNNRKNRTTAGSSSNSTAKSSSGKAAAPPTQAIDIPNSHAHPNASNAAINNSMASSNNSSTSASVNNSFSSVSVSSSSACQTTSIMESTSTGLTSAPTAIPNSLSAFASKLEDSQADELLESVNKLESKNDFQLVDNTSKPKPADSTSDSVNEPNVSLNSRLKKRRYKSGLPLASDRNDHDSIEDASLKQLCEANFGKQSKDDSGILNNHQH